MRPAVPILLACLGAVSCSDEKNVTAPPDNSPGELSVTLAVTGDPAAGFAEYPVYSFDQEIGKIRPGETSKFQLDGYSHLIELGPLRFFYSFRLHGKPLSWCEPTTAESFSVHPTSSHPVSITFGLNCPPLDGEGEINLSFDLFPAVWSDSTLAVHLHRVGATPNDVSFDAIPSKGKVIRLSPGLYWLDARNSKCETSWYDAVLDQKNQVIVRKDQTFVYSIVLRCKPG